MRSCASVLPLQCAGPLVVARTTVRLWSAAVRRRASAPPRGTAAHHCTSSRACVELRHNPLPHCDMATLISVIVHVFILEVPRTRVLSPVKGVRRNHQALHAVPRAAMLHSPPQRLQVASERCDLATILVPRARRVLRPHPLQLFERMKGCNRRRPFVPRARWTLRARPHESGPCPPGRVDASGLVPRRRRILRPKPLQLLNRPVCDVVFVVTLVLDER
mmetsp:Transcript_7099/g.16934  ORF Transcript_7099/g.16934 Transcript_7099/m.16934 type:complete len:219 (+) Transcript_7099:93-749(+)